VTSYKKTLEKVLLGTSDANIRFSDLRTLLLALGFEERIRGSHRIFKRDDIEEIVTLQPRGSKAKSYQVKQVRKLINENRLASHGDE
jgi:predicted RNA binding protein YcfA (HicA-like mRNA interferase family)